MSIWNIEEHRTEIGKKIEELAKRLPLSQYWLANPYDPTSYVIPTPAGLGVGGAPIAMTRWATESTFEKLSRLLQKVQSAKSLPLVEKDFVPTSKNIAQKMLDWVLAGGGEYKNILEPHGGEGHLIREIQERTGVLPKVLELSKRRVAKLREMGIPAEQSDFLKHSGEYDAIFMNPPFSKGQSKLHILHGLELLKPGGRGAALVPGRDLIGERPMARLLRENPDVKLLGHTTMMNPKTSKSLHVGIVGFTKIVKE